MAPPTKGKQATKGAKQIHEENTATLNFYRNMALIANAVSLIILCIYNTAGDFFLFFFAICVYVACYQFMAFMAKSKFTDSGQLLESGVDLNMEGGIAEHVKDIIILTAGCQLLAVMSNYFWLLWLLAPCRGFWILWKNILSPWFFQEAPSQPEMDEKKQKKMERKMKRQRQ